MRIRLPMALCWICASLAITGQDTITLMHYNLLNYGNTTTYCTQANNSITAKAAAMGIICTFAAPDILTVNEIGANSFAPTHFLNNVLNINGVNYYQGSTLTNASGGDLANFLFYDSRKFVLHSQHQLATTVRDINIYRLYHNDPNLPLHQDTAILFVIVSHLKAGTASADAAERAAMAKILMDSSGLWSGYPALLSGDFNLYTSNEQAWKNLTQPADTTGEVFFDPANKIGSWQDNQLFSSVHTQSVRSSSNGCASGGGLDDRFDFILMNKALKNSPGFYSYLPGSYKVIGNDGNHLNQSITSGTNTSVPSIILQQLYEASDHLPVVMNLLLVPSTQGIGEDDKGPDFGSLAYHGGTFAIRLSRPASLREVRVFDLSGRVVFQQSLPDESASVHRVAPGFPVPDGFYILQAATRSGHTLAGKVIVR